MSESTNTIKLAPDEDIQLSPQQVRKYLLANPEFFAHYPNLVNDIEIPHQAKGAVSLVELRSEQLRERVQELQSQIGQILNMAKQNERIYRLYAELNLRLFQCNSLPAMREVLQTSIVEEFDLAAVALHLFNDSDALNASCQPLIKKRFKNEFFFFGRMTQEENRILFSEEAVQSVALMLLGEKGELGMLAIASREADHFTPEMDTLLIAQLQQLLTLLVSKVMQ